jgi:hypothetical protein
MECLLAVFAKYGAEGIGNLTQGAMRLYGGNDIGHQVLTGAGRFTDFYETFFCSYP